MPDRRPIKKQHERFHIGNFVRWLNDSQHCRYEVTAEPEPPDAVIVSGSRTSWIEISTAFLDHEYARDVMSSATPGEEHISSANRLISGPDQLAAETFISVVKTKLEKKSYLPVAEKYGPGYLVVPVHNPLFDGDTLKLMLEGWSRASINDLGCFGSVIVSYRPLRGVVYQDDWVFQALPGMKGTRHHPRAQRGVPERSAADDAEGCSAHARRHRSVQ